ncbi:MAG TPA: hypothetical protein VLV29_06995 [Steroidobacteraceae bacterium]|nr:hypothetical protein [Steroidobacteraceae bacterium]
MPESRRAAALTVLAGALVCSAAAGAAPVQLVAAGATIEIEAPAVPFTHGAETIREWVQRSAEIVAAYYGRFPVPRLRLTLRSLPGEGVHGGQTFADPDAYIRVGVGREVTGAQLVADWVLVHEMTHLALPDTGDEHAWLSEGIATYVEGVARVQAGNRAETDVWAEELRAMPHGMPQPGDQGLDHTHTWGRTYWGGAMFCLIADVTIRERTQNRRGLQDALRAVLLSSGGLSAHWPIERVLRTGDAAVGVNVLEELYAKYGDAPVTPDLAQLWNRLGVVREGESVRLDESAPLAATRRAIMRSP